MNFTLWGFGSEEKTASRSFQTHYLIAVREGLYIDEFNHEGTGVTPRSDRVESRHKVLLPVTGKKMKKGRSGVLIPEIF